jgi:Sec-independent protein translocase protein TatA
VRPDFLGHPGARSTIPPMDLLVVLLVLLILALIWRGPKTLPQLGNMFGRGVRAARDEADRMRADKDTPKGPDDPS